MLPGGFLVTLGNSGSYTLELSLSGVAMDL